jgi:hypothetical protein
MSLWFVVVVVVVVVVSEDAGLSFQWRELFVKNSDHQKENIRSSHESQSNIGEI